MNAISTVDGDMRRPIAPPHATHKFGLLLKREFWEHKGGFFWSPLVAGGISLLFTTMGLIVAEVMARRALANGTLSVGDTSVKINGLDLGAITARMSAEDLRQFAGAVNISATMAASWAFIVLTFVVFFYCLGALYDERKDRSVLFWKSLPLSDSETVLSKVASAVVVAPIIAAGAALATMIGFLVVLSVFVLIHGGNPIQLLWIQAQPFHTVMLILAVLPIYALWSLPTVGWLLLCSAWARGKPFLWAIMIPVFAGIFVSWFNLMHMFSMESSWFWKNVVARLLLGTIPGSWYSDVQAPVARIEGPGDFGGLLNIHDHYSVLLTPQLWLGVLAGAAMIFAAIRLRRWRDEG